MSIRRIVLYILTGALALTALACKKDEKTETLPSLSGLRFELPPFGRIGETFKMEPYGVSWTTEKDPAVRYHWKVNSGDADTVFTYTFTPKELGTYTITCTAFADDYYSVTSSHQVDIIDPTLGKTLHDTGISATDPHIVDKRSGAASENTYYYTEDTASGLTWFRNNLAWTGSGRAYMNTDVTSYVLGRYYTWEEAMTACPDGWRLPTLDEINTVFGADAGALMVNAYLNDNRMWEFWPQVDIRDDGRYAFIPSGYANSVRNTFHGLYEYAGIWTSDTDPADAGMAYFFYLNVNDPEAHTGTGDKASLALSVRCVR